MAVKVQISIDENLLCKIDSYSKTNYLSRSGFISLACNQYLNQQIVMAALVDMSAAMRKIADTGDIDESALKQMQDLETLLQYVSIK